MPPQSQPAVPNHDSLSEMISAQAIRVFDDRVREMRAVINETLKPLGVAIRPSVSYDVLMQHAELFDPVRHRQLLADKLGIPRDHLAATDMEVAGESDTSAREPGGEAKENAGNDVCRRDGPGQPLRGRGGRFCHA